MATSKEKIELKNLVGSKAKKNKDINIETGSWRLKGGLAQMLKGGVIMDVINADEAKIAEQSGAVAVMALERVPADIRKDGGVARMSDPKMIKEIISSVSIPVMAKCRIGHLAEAQILQHLGVDYADESEVLTPADNNFHINKWDFNMPFVCGATDLGEALRRIGEGTAMIRTKGEAGTGDVVQAVYHARTVNTQLKKVLMLDKEELMYTAKKIGAPFEILQKVAELGKLPVPNFAAGGIATPADASLMMQLGAETVFVGSGIFKSDDPAARAKAVVEATTNYNDSAKVAKASTGLKKAMMGLDMKEIAPEDRLQERGW
mgnify:CR=1 FL=1